tara:strand:+ start:189 stop:431 length:243 start_codon:yes stop_codon:yes gene_type:complete
MEKSTNTVLYLFLFMWVEKNLHPMFVVLLMVLLRRRLRTIELFAMVLAVGIARPDAVNVMMFVSWTTICIALMEEYHRID